MTDELAALTKHHRRTPEFMFANITDVNSTGMTGDTLLHSAVIKPLALSPFVCAQTYERIDPFPSPVQNCL